MNIQEVLRTINQMQTDGVVRSYAVGGAVGATFYLEPVATLDVDIFISFEPEPGQLIVSPKPVFDYLAQRGHSMAGEYVIIAETPVQFLPPGSPLIEEGLEQAITHDLEGIPAHVFTAEHLAAIALQTGRAKDKARLLQFVEEGALDSDQFQHLIARHGLAEQWQRFQRQFLDDTP